MQMTPFEREAKENLKAAASVAIEMLKNAQTDEDVVLLNEMLYAAAAECKRRRIETRVAHMAERSA